MEYFMSCLSRVIRLYLDSIIRHAAKGELAIIEMDRHAGLSFVMLPWDLGFLCYACCFGRLLARADVYAILIALTLKTGQEYMWRRSAPNQKAKWIS